MNYLKYIELSAENLQFFLWFRDYCKRFEQLPDREKALSPLWSEANIEDNQHPRTKGLGPETAAVFKGTDFANGPKVTETEKSNPFFTPPRTPNEDAFGDVHSIDSYAESVNTSGKVDHSQRAHDAFESAGLKWKPCKYH
jgi:hypothetical protein